MSRTHAFGFTSLFILATFSAVLVAPSVAADENGTLLVQELNEKALYEQPAGRGHLFGVRHAALVNVTDADLVEPTISVLATSDSDPDGETLRLQRIGLFNIGGQPTPVYHGLLAVELTRVAGNGLVAVSDRDTISLVYIDDKDTSGTTVVRQAFVTWHQTHQGSISLGSGSFAGACTQADVVVNDLDLTTATVTVNVTSTTQTAPSPLVLTRVTDGLYTGKLDFSAGCPSPGTGTVTVKDGDRFTVYYKNYGPTGDIQNVTASGSWRNSYTGRVQFVTSDYRTLVSETADIGSIDPTDPSVYGVQAGTTAATAGAWFRVEDPDRRGHGSVTIQVGSFKPGGAQTNVDPTGRTLTLTETGAGTGEFTGFLGFIVDAPSTGNRLRVDDGAVIEARYTDPKDAQGTNNVLIKSQAAWRRTHSGTVDFVTGASSTGVAAQYNPKWVSGGCAGSADCIPGLAHLMLVDKDLNTDPSSIETATVRLISADTVGSSAPLRDARGIEVTLTEESANSATFRATVQFNHTYSNGTATPHYSGGPSYPTIWVKCADTLQAIYLDGRGLDAMPRVVTKSIPMAAAGDGCTMTAPDVPTGTGAPSLKISTIAGGAAATQFTGLSTSSVPVTVHVELVDAQLNKVTTSAETNTFRLYAESTQTWPAAWKNPNQLAPIKNVTEGSNANMSVKLTETGANTGIFRGSFQLWAPGQRQSGDVPRLPVAVDGELVCANYVHVNATGVRDVVLRSCATWRPATQSVQGSDLQFRDALQQGKIIDTSYVPGAGTALFQGLGRAYVFVRDADVFADATNGPDTVSVNIRSDSDTTGINVLLTERYGHHYMHSPSMSDDPCVHTFGGGSGCPNPVADTPVDDRGFLGSFNFSLSQSDDTINQLRVKDGDTVTVFYEESLPGGGSTSSTYSMAWNQTYTGTLSINPSEIRVKKDANDPANFIEVTVQDRDGNLTAGLDSIQVAAQNPRGTATAVTLFEVDPHSGIFRGKFELCRTPGCTVPGASARLEFKDEDTITVTYIDRYDATGAEKVLRATALARNVTAGKLTLDQPRYNGYGTIGGITLEDKDLDTTSNRDEVRVFAWSGSDAQGEYIVLRETGGSTGIFQGGFGFEDGGGDLSTKRSNGALIVKDGDRISVYYVDRNLDADATVGPDEPAAKRVNATWSLFANVGPTLGLNTTPPAASGTLNVAPGVTVIFHLNATDADGSLATWSLDFGDATAPATGTTAVPTEGVAHAFATAGQYTVRFNATDDTGLSSSLTLLVIVAVPDNDPPGPVTSLSVDQIRADSVRLTWTAPQNNPTAADGVKVGSYQIRRSSGPITTEAQWNGAVPVQATFDPLTLATPGTLQHATVTGLNAATTYTLAVRAADTQNLGPIVAVSATTLVQDSTPPQGVPVVRSSHQAGVASGARNVTFTWEAVVDEESAVSYRYKWNTLQDQTVIPTDTQTTQTSITFPNVSNGRYYFHLAACSAGGTLCGSTVTYGPVIIEGTAAGPTPSQIQAANSKLVVKVQRSGSDNVVTWTLPADPPLPIAGVQVWRSTSPYTLRGTFEAVDPEFTARRYVDKDAPANATYKVTMFYTLNGQRFGYAASDPSGIPGFDSLSDTGTSKGGGLEWYWLVVIALAALLFIAIVLVLVVSLRQKPAEDEWAEKEPKDGWPGEEWPEEGQEAWPDQGQDAWPEDAWPETEGLEAEPEPEPWEEEVSDGLPVPADAATAEPAAPGTEHLLTCPTCHTEFIATGQKPLVTQCPSCGVKGVLR